MENEESTAIYRVLLYSSLLLSIQAFAVLPNSKVTNEKLLIAIRNLKRNKLLILNLVLGTPCSPFALRVSYKRHGLKSQFYDKSSYLRVRTLTQQVGK